MKLNQYDATTARIYWEMMGKTEFEHHPVVKMPLDPSPGNWICSKCGTNLCEDEYGEVAHDPRCPVPDPIPLSPWELAGFMRDKCEKRLWTIELEKISRPFPLVAYSTPQQWIKAACKAWRSK